ncbi:MAG: GAF domain-containing protein [Bacteroidota bacterium]
MASFSLQHFSPPENLPASFAQTLLDSLQAQRIVSDLDLEKANIPTRMPTVQFHQQLSGQLDIPLIEAGKILINATFPKSNILDGMNRLSQLSYWLKETEAGWLDIMSWDKKIGHLSFSAFLPIPSELVCGCLTAIEQLFNGVWKYQIHECAGVGCHINVSSQLTGDNELREKLTFERKISRLNELAVALNEVKSPEESFSHLSDCIGELTGTNRATLAILLENRRQVRFIGFNINREFNDYLQNIDVQQSVLGEVLRSREMVYQPDLKCNDWIENPQLVANGLQSGINLPIIVGDTVWGVLNAGKEELDGFSSEDQIMLKQIASLLGQTIENLVLEAEKDAALEDVSRKLDLLKQERVLLQVLIDATPDLIFMKDLDGVYFGCNQAFATFTGKSREEVIGSDDFALFPKEVAMSFRQQDEMMMEKQSARINEQWVDHPEKGRICIDKLKTPIHDADHPQLHSQTEQ